MVHMATDRPNQLDDLWTDWETKTLPQKQAILKKAMGMGSKVLFSRQDSKNLVNKALEVGKALNLSPDEKTLITPNKKWLVAHDPEFSRAQRMYKRWAAGDRSLKSDDPWAPSPDRPTKQPKLKLNLE